MSEVQAKYEPSPVWKKIKVADIEKATYDARLLIEKIDNLINVKRYDDACKDCYILLSNVIYLQEHLSSLKNE